jgi:hypothetical protein
MSARKKAGGTVEAKATSRGTARPRVAPASKTTGADTSDAAVSEATGRTWTQWFAVLDAHGAANLPHKKVAAWLQSEHGATSWWSQTITVTYERRIGRREVGQRCGGSFGATASRTIAGTLDEALAAWQRWVLNRREFDGVALAGEPRISSTDKWRYWRADLADGSKLALAISAKPAGKSQLAMEHSGLPDASAADLRKKFWKELLAAVA